MEVSWLTNYECVERQREAVIDESRTHADSNDAEANRSIEAQAAAVAMVNADQQRELLSKLSNQDDVDQTRSLVAPIVQHMCATLIQKIARGVITRAAFSSLKIEYYVSSKYIQAAVRGFLARRRVAKMFWDNAASVVIQRAARGMLARRFIRARRRHLRVLQSTLQLQKVVRGHFGRVRMRKVRHLCGARSDIVAAPDRLSVSDLKELAGACFAMVSMPSASPTIPAAEASSKPLTPLVLGLVRVLMLFTCDSDTDADVSNVRWKEAATFLRCSVRLTRRMKMIASAAEARHLRTSQLGNALLDAFMADRDFHEDTFRRLESGWKAATAIFRWVASFSVITRLQTVLPATNVGYAGPFLIASATSSREAAQDQVEEKENAVREESVERRFVPAALLQVAGFPKHRPRPVVLVFAHDVPLRAKTQIVERLLTALPGLFVVLNRSSAPADHQHYVNQRTAAMIEHSPSFLSLKAAPWASRRMTPDWEGLNISDIRGAVSIGYSVIVESDIGLSDPHQRKFLGAFSAVKAAIQPPPLCILVKGSLENCATKDTDRSCVPDADADADAAASRCSNDRPMADAAIKQAFEKAAEHLAELSQSHIVAQMAQVSTVESPVIHFVVVVEAVIVLLTPTKRYDGPKASTSYVSWKLGRRLLASPRVFCAKLREVKQHDVPPDNLLVLDKYLRLGDWPTKTRAHSLGPSGELLFALASWVEAVVQCAHLVANCQGLAPEISRTTPVRGLFGNVVTFHDTKDDKNERQEYDVDTCVLKLMDAVLADVRVYRTCHELDGRRCIINVYHDCLRIYFFAYDPTSSWRWQTMVPESEVDNLLAPNSVERGNVKVPPTTKAELYGRLVKLCLLQAQKSFSLTPSVKASSEESTLVTRSHPHSMPQVALLLADKQLVVRPPSIRLYRRALQLGGCLTTITISELSRGRVQVEAFVHSSSHGKDLRTVFSLESILERMSARQAAACFVAPSEIPQLVLDRLHLFRVAQSLTTREKCASVPQPRNGKATSLLLRSRQEQHLIDDKMDLKLGIRRRETAPGRLLMRKAVRSPWLSGVWVCSVFAKHATNDFRAEFYQPQTCEHVSVRLSQLDCEDFVLQSKHASKPALQLMMKRFRFQVDPETGSAVSCHARRVLARFPWSIPVQKSSLHAINARDVVRTYIQVERRERGTATRSPRLLGQLQYRVWLPDTCDEQTLVLEDSEIESYFVDGSWLSASSMTERKHMSHELVRCFEWEPETTNAGSTSSASPASRHGRVVAQLPSGVVASFVSTRATGKQKQPPPPRPPTRIKRSPFTARGSLDQVPVLSSCVQLLDAAAVSIDSTADAPLEKPIKRCYTYNSEELVHKGSYRVNGVLVVVQVFMKAVVVDTLVPQIPVDRVKQEDSFVLTLNFYHPDSSSGAAVRISGLKELREVVGPDRAALIRASAVHELMQHIVERRTEVVLKPVAKVVRSQSFRGHEPISVLQDDKQSLMLRMEVNLQRDRLYAKQKATPINQSLAPDHAANVTKLIDKAPERGLKVLTKTRQIREFGRVIFTVFDVAFTRSLRSGSRGNGDLSAAAFRVDAYIHDTSARLSLVVDGADLLRVSGDSLELPLSDADDSRSADPLNGDERRRQLAQLIVDHIGIEGRRDGVTRDQLFLTEYFAPASTQSRDANPHIQRAERKTTGRQLLFKATRALGCDHILISTHLLADCAIAIRCYEPRSSESCDLVVKREMLSLVLGLDESELTPSVLLAPSIPQFVLMTHICSFVRIEKRAVAAVFPLASDATLTASFEFDEASARTSRQRLESGGARTPEKRKLVGSWSGMMTGRVRASYFAVRIQLLKTDSLGSGDALSAYEAICSALSPSTTSVASVRFAAIDLKRLEAVSEAAVVSTEDLMERLRKRLHVELVDVEPCEVNDFGVAVSIELA